jgi:hypothetical protein
MDALAEPFTPSDVQWCVSATNKEKTKGVALAYIDSRAVMDHLDAACGPENWRYEVTDRGVIPPCVVIVQSLLFLVTLTCTGLAQDGMIHHWVGVVLSLYLTSPYAVYLSSL